MRPLEYQHVLLRPQQPTVHPVQHRPPTVVPIQVDCSPPFTQLAASGLAPGAVGYGTSFPQAAKETAIPYPEIGYYPSSHPTWSGAHGAQQWGPGMGLPGQEVPVQQQQPQTNMVHLQGPVRPHSMPGLPMLVPSSDPEAAHHSMLQPQLQSPSSNHWAIQSEQAAKAQLARSKSSLVGSPEPELQVSQQPPLPEEDVQPPPALVPSSAPDQRPVLKIQPRTKPATEVAMPLSKPVGIVPKEVHDALKELVVGDPTAPSSPPKMERPRLKLKPRSKPVEEPEIAPPEERKASVFGNALPREVVLNKRGESANPVVATGSRQAGSSWQKVLHKKGGSGSPPKHYGKVSGPAPRRYSATPMDDPFFGDYLPPSRTLSATISSLELRPPACGSVPVHHSCGLDQVSSPFMKRALPTRNDDFF